MSCCSGRRATLTRSTGLRSVPAPAGPVASPSASATATVMLTYSGPVPMVLASPTGAAPYALQAAGQRLGVVAGDAAALLLTGWFARA